MRDLGWTPVRMRDLTRGGQGASSRLLLRHSE